MAVTTRMGESAGMPRPEYPRPQFVRADWMCLNGPWHFQLDRTDSGLEDGLLDSEFEHEILVPFSPESRLSGIDDQGYLEAVWYRRRFSIPPEWTDRRTLLHFQAVDYDATVWVDGEEVVRHRGGFTPFTADLGYREGDITIVVRARDPRSGSQPRGKQAVTPENFGACYTRTTGIWQTVWLEPVPASYFLRPRITPDVAQGGFHVQLAIRGERRGLWARATVGDGSGEIASCAVPVDVDLGPRLTLPIPSSRRRYWCPNDPYLYELTIELLDPEGAVVDRLHSYAGLRSLSIDGTSLLLNGKRLFQRLVADQGYYPDGVYTAPSEEALVRDIELAQAAGFNGARLHQKVFEERYLYHCDRLGYLVWGEFPDWGSASPTNSELQPGPTYITQWLEALERDYSHPSIVGWCPLNETLEPITDRLSVLDDVTAGMFLATKAFDATRPVLDVSGFSHRVRQADVYDSHNYEQDPAVFQGMMTTGSRPFINGDSGDPTLIVTGALPEPWSIAYSGQPYFCSEWGGILWAPELTEEELLAGYVDPNDANAHLQRKYWSARVAGSTREFYDRFEALASVLLENENVFGYCYFQLYDTYHERLGLFAFDRSPKFDVARLKSIQTRPAAIELY